MPQVMEPEAGGQTGHLARASLRRAHLLHGDAGAPGAVRHDRLPRPSGRPPRTARGASSDGIGTGVREVSVLSGSPGHCTAGETMPRMKSTSTTRRLTQGPNGYRTVPRHRASSKGAAEKLVTDRIDDGVNVIGSSVAGCGLGSGDSA